MTASNYDWAASQLDHKYPGWVGIDHLIGDAVQARLGASARVLDVGCGRNSPLGARRGQSPFVAGTDIDLEEIRHNGDCDGLVVADAARLPFAERSFDLVLSKTAIEHMLAPAEFFADVHRVLAPGGVFVWATSNLRSLPIMVSWLTPIAVHRWVYRRMFGADLQLEQFPTYYRANTETAVERHLAAAGFERVGLWRASWPHYFAFSRLLFGLMLPIHRWSDRFDLQWLQVHLIGVHRKRP